MRLDYPFDIGDLRGLPVSSLLSDCKPGRGHQVESDAVSEWSKELALGASPVRVAGSNPVRIRPFFLYTPSCILSCLSSTSSCQSTTMSFASQFSPIFEPPVYLGYPISQSGYNRDFRLAARTAGLPLERGLLAFASRGRATRGGGAVPRGMAANCGDIHINVHQGRQGYGIHFQLSVRGIFVTAVDALSEAERAGVQPGACDCPKILPSRPASAPSMPHARTLLHLSA